MQTENAGFGVFTLGTVLLCCWSDCLVCGLSKQCVICAVCYLAGAWYYIFYMSCVQTGLLWHDPGHGRQQSGGVCLCVSKGWLAPTLGLSDQKLVPLLRTLMTHSLLSLSRRCRQHQQIQTKCGGSAHAGWPEGLLTWQLEYDREDPSPLTSLSLSLHISTPPLWDVDGVV